MKPGPWFKRYYIIPITISLLIHLHLTTAFMSHEINSRLTNAHSTAPLRCSTTPHSSSSSSTSTSGEPNAILQNFGLTPTQATSVLNRQPIKSSNNSTKITAVLDWLPMRGRFTSTQAAAIVLGHPPILHYDIDTNLAPTIKFYQDALNETRTAAAPVIIGNEMVPPIGPRLTRFLCESPGLLEYNVKKRLAPRLKRVQDQIQPEGSTRVVVDEETLRAISTKTDSRFDEWLRLRLDDGTTNRNNGDNGPQKLDESVDDTDEDTVVHGIKRTPSSYVVVSNLQSGGNIGNILRSASIFGCEECVVVGQKRHRLTGDHGSRFDLRRHHIWSHTEAREYLHQKGVRIYGIEIMANASPVMKYDPVTGVVRFPFDRRWLGAAFVMGNEGNGLSDISRGKYVMNSCSFHRRGVDGVMVAVVVALRVLL